MANYDYDLFVIGAGSGGVRAARVAAMSSAKVAVAEEYRVGGTCVIRGCVPKKFMVYAAEFAHYAQVAEGYGWSKSQAVFDLADLPGGQGPRIARLSGIYVTNLQNAGAELLHGKARVVGPHTLEVTGETGQVRKVTAGKILVATGEEAVQAGGDPRHRARHHLGRGLPPAQAAQAGAGGRRRLHRVEFAGIFAGLGVDTTLVYRGANILRGFDDDVRTHLTEEMKKRGIKVVLGTQHDRIEKTPTGLVNHLTNGHAIETDVVMFATGRKPYVEGLGLETAGVQLTESGAVAVDQFSKTSADHIWAVGDVTDRINLTPVAIREERGFRPDRVPQQPAEL